MSAVDEQKEQWIKQLLSVSDNDVKMTEKQRKIVDAAIEVFSEKGYSASSTNEIAQKAGVAEGTIFRHYKTKKELLLSIVSPIVAKTIAPFVLKDFYKVLDTPFPRYEDFLRAVLQNRIEFVKRHLPVLRILVQEIPFHPELREQYKAVIAENVIPRLRATIERFQTQGVVRADFPAETVIRLSMTTVLGFLFVRFFLLAELSWDDEAETERTIQFLVHGLSGPLDER